MAVVPVVKSPGSPIQRTLEFRNKANTTKNWAKVEQHLTQIEKVYGVASSWALRERFESGAVSLADVLRR